MTARSATVSRPICIGISSCLLAHVQGGRTDRGHLVLRGPAGALLPRAAARMRPRMPSVRIRAVGQPGGGGQCQTAWGASARAAWPVAAVGGGGGARHVAPFPCRPRRVLGPGGAAGGLVLRVGAPARSTGGQRLAARRRVPRRPAGLPGQAWTAERLGQRRAAWDAAPLHRVLRARALPALEGSALPTPWSQQATPTARRYRRETDRVKVP
jgi:hypothetical protein